MPLSQQWGGRVEVEEPGGRTASPVAEQKTGLTEKPRRKRSEMKGTQT